MRSTVSMVSSGLLEGNNSVSVCAPRSVCIQIITNTSPPNLRPDCMLMDALDDACGNGVRRRRCLIPIQDIKPHLKPESKSISWHSPNPEWSDTFRFLFWVSATVASTALPQWLAGIPNAKPKRKPKVAMWLMTQIDSLIKQESEYYTLQFDFISSSS